MQSSVPLTWCAEGEPILYSHPADVFVAKSWHQLQQRPQLSHFKLVAKTQTMIWGSSPRRPPSSASPSNLGRRSAASHRPLQMKHFLKFSCFLPVLPAPDPSCCFVCCCYLLCLFSSSSACVVLSLPDLKNTKSRKALPSAGRFMLRTTRSERRQKH